MCPSINCMIKRYLSLSALWHVVLTFPAAYRVSAIIRQKPESSTSLVTHWSENCFVIATCRLHISSNKELVMPVVKGGYKKSQNPVKTTNKLNVQLIQSQWRARADDTRMKAEESWIKTLVSIISCYWAACDLAKSSTGMFPQQYDRWALKTYPTCISEC